MKNAFFLKLFGGFIAILGTSISLHFLLHTIFESKRPLDLTIDLMIAILLISVAIIIYTIKLQDIFTYMESEDYGAIPNSKVTKTVVTHCENNFKTIELQLIESEYHISFSDIKRGIIKFGTETQLLKMCTVAVLIINPNKSLSISSTKLFGHQKKQLSEFNKNIINIITK